MSTSSEGQVPREVVEAAWLGICGGQDSSCLMEVVSGDIEPGLIAAISHPAFAPWFLRRLAGQEPSGPWQVDPHRVGSKGTQMWGCYNLRLDTAIGSGDWIGPDGRLKAAIVAHALNALAPASAPDAQEGGKTE